MTRIRNRLFIKLPKCEIGYLLNDQNAEMVIYQITKCEIGYLSKNQNAKLVIY